MTLEPFLSKISFLSVDGKFFYDNITYTYTELHFSFLKMQENFCGWVLDYFLLPGNFSEKKTVNASAAEVVVIFILGGEWNFTFKCGVSKGVLV